MPPPDAATPTVLDLCGTPCPLAWARAKVRLETLPSGTLVELLTDDARTVRDLPRAAEANGHHVIEVTARGAATRIRIEV